MPEFSKYLHPSYGLKAETSPMPLLVLVLIIFENFAKVSLAHLRIHLFFLEL